MIDTWYCIRCGKMKESKVFPSDGLCPECREAQRVIDYTNRTKCEGDCDGCKHVMICEIKKEGFRK